MTQERDMDLLLDLWMSDGPTHSPDRVIDVVADRIERQPQRPVWRLHPRETHVNTMLRAGIALAAVVVISIVGYNFLPGRSNGIGGPPAGPSPTLPASTPPSSSPSASFVPTGCMNAGLDCPSPLPAGPVTSKVFTPSVSYTAPAGYIEFSDTAQAYGVTTAEGSAPGGFLIVRDPAPSSQANDCEGDPIQGIVAYTVDSITSAFGGDDRFLVTAPARVTIGRYKGKTFDLQLASTWTGTCPWSNGQPAAMVLTVQGGATATSPSYGIQAGDPSIRVYLLDVGGKPVWIQIDKSTADQVQPVLQTLSFAP